MSHSAPADGAQKHSSGTIWELVPLPPITYHVKTLALPSTGDGRPFSPNNYGASPAGANADASTTAAARNNGTRKRKRPVCLTLPATVGREFLVRSTLSACDRCNVVGRKRIKRGDKSGGKDSPAAAAALSAADITSTLCQRCQNIYNGGKYLSKQMARFDLVTADTTEEDQSGMEGSGTTIRLSALGSNAVAIQINKVPININQQGPAKAIVKQGDVVSFLLNPRGVRDEKDCAAAAATATSANADDNGGKQSKEEEFWSMRFSVVQSKCVGKDSQNAHDESDCRSEQRKGKPRESESVLDHAGRGGENTEEKKRKGGVDVNGECDPKSPHLSDHQDDEGDDHEELDETPVLSMHHFSATQWQNQSAMDITSMVADTPYTYDDDEDNDEDHNSDDNDSESDTLPALGANKANDPSTAKKGFGDDQDSIDEDNGRDLSSFSLQELKKLRDRFNTATATGVTIAANSAGADPTPSNVDEISASFHRALFFMAIRHEEKSIVHDDEDGEKDSRRTADRAKPGACSSEEEDDEEGNDTLCDQEILLPKLLEYTTMVE